MSALDVSGLTAREAIDRLLRATAAALTKAGEPPGCPLVLGAIECWSEGESVSAYLHELRGKTPPIILVRIRCGLGDGNVCSRVDVDAMAMLVTTFANGLPIPPRDDALRAALTAAVDWAMSAWDTFGAWSEFPVYPQDDSMTSKVIAAAAASAAAVTANFPRRATSEQTEAGCWASS